ncbi:small ribosomal subunit protein mS39-like [Ornithodoros turicata]|uniref:small ribosomal subunit protein mS39-like n=1 Tax=Ornithodoros turicata TaxID=34597 RepID=UPI00313A35D2
MTNSLHKIAMHENIRATNCIHLLGIISHATCAPAQFKHEKFRRIPPAIDIKYIMAARSIFTRREYLGSKNVNYFIRCCVRNASSANETATASSQIQSQPISDGPIIIPKRIHRGPTDILKALASTVTNKDYTAPHFKYHDDPFFIPASNVAKRTYALAKESGKKAAKYFLEKYPDSFKHNPAEPNIEAFNPKPKYTAESEVSEEDLKHLIDAVDVENASTVYNNLKSKGTSITPETTQSLLELLCFYNCNPVLDEDLTEERWHRQLAPRETRKTWKDGGLAEEIFNSMENKDSRAYSALVQGMAKYFQVDRAYATFKEMQEKGLKPSLEAYNGLLSLVPFLKEGYEQRWSLTKELLEGIQKDGLKPNITTMNNVLDTVSKFGASPSARQYALQVFGEMKHLGIEPSLASYYYLLVIFCKTRGGSQSNILHSIINELENKDFTIKDPKDVYFFVSAMDVCHNYLLDKDLAYRIHALLNYGQNYSMIGDAFKESIYYQHFFKLLCSTESIHTFFELYDKYVPNIYTPEPSVVCEIIEAIDLNDALEYIPQLWSDIIIFNHYERENVIKGMLSVMAKGKREAQLQEQFATIVSDIRERCVKEEDSGRRFLRTIQWTGQMLGDMMTVYLNAEDKLAEAWEVMMKLDKEQHKILGYPEQGCLKHFCRVCLERSQQDRAVFCAKYAAEIGLTDVGQFLMQPENIEKLSDESKEALKEILDFPTLTGEPEPKKSE